MPSFIWQRIDRAPLGAEQLLGFNVLRLDLIHGLAPGNKIFKLEPCIADAKAKGFRRLLSFGGAWSNHLHALAALGQRHGLATVGVVRGEPDAPLTATLAEAQAAGMQLHYLSRTAYRQRHDRVFQRQLLARYGPAYLIPEGGDCLLGASGCMAIGEELVRQMPSGASIILPVGTGTTLAGIVASLGPAYRVIGISALKGALDTASRVQRHLDQIGHSRDRAAWEICHDYHCGGFARAPVELREFLLSMEQSSAIPLEPVYSAKALLAAQKLLAAGQLDRSKPLVFIHTGGLQGRRGFDWLSDPGSVLQ